MTNLDERTKIPLFTAVSLMIAIAGGIIWLTTIANKAEAAQEELKGLREIVTDIQTRVIRIEEHQKKERR